MGSLTYEIAHLPVDEHKLGNRRSAVMTQTIKAYRNDAIHFGAWCKQRYGARHPEDCVPHIQDYADYLVAAGKSPSTVHKYMAGVCRVFGVELQEIRKPRRVVADNTRSRGAKAVDLRPDAQRAASPRLYDFAERVGIRRAEYAALRGTDFGEDAVGAYVLVRRGKGGKRQKQRLLPEDVDFIRDYFDGSDNYVFSKTEMKNKIDLHHLRAIQGQRMYQYYAARCAADPDYRDKLLADIRWVWDEDDQVRITNGLRPKRWSPRLYEGRYHLRGRTRKLAQELELPTGYDRLCVLAVSVLHLAHWRLDVTVDNYLLAK